MFRKQVNPKTAAILTLVLLAVIQGVYWRLLVYREPAEEGPGMGGGGAPPDIRSTQGYNDIVVETVTGDEPGFQDGPLWQARFSGPNALAIDRNGTLYIADSRNHRVRALSPAGQVRTVAGGGAPGGAGGSGNGPASEPRFRYPSGVAVAADGTLYVSDTGNHRICRVRNGQVSTLATKPLRFPAALTLDKGGALWVADVGAGAVRKVAPDGTVSTPAPTPPGISAKLGEIRAAKSRPKLLAPPLGSGLPVPTQFQVERRSPGAFAGKWRFYGDPNSHVVMGDGPVGAAVLVAGRRMAGPSEASSIDGDGGRSGFAGPCALAAGPGNVVYVAEYEGNRIRRLRLPEWMMTGAAPSSRPPGRAPDGR